MFRDAQFHHGIEMENLSQSRGRKSQLLLSLPKSEEIAIGLHPDAQQVALKGDTRLNSLFDLRRIVARGANGGSGRSHRPVSPGEIEVGLGSRQNRLLPLGF